MKTGDTPTGACTAIPLAGANGGVWPPAWLKSAAAAAKSPALPRSPAAEPVAIPDDGVPDLELPDAKPAIAPTLAHQAARCARCHCPDYIDVPIHNGQSIRRDCTRCGRLIDFPLWYGEADGVPV